MPTKDELTDEIVLLKEEIVALKEGTVDESPEPTETLIWPHPVDTSIGSNPSAFGFSLRDDGENMVADVPESRVETELARGFIRLDVEDEE